MVYDTFFPVSKSFLSSAALAETIAETYDLANVHCQLIAAFMRDVYRVTSGEQRYIFCYSAIPGDQTMLFK